MPKKTAKAEEAESFEEADKAKPKARSRATDDEADLKSATADSLKESSAAQVSVTREQGGRTKAIVANEALPVNAQLKVTAGGGKHVTVIGVRRDGVPYVYARGESANGQPVMLAVKLRPTSARVPEALFVVVGDAPVSLAKEPLTGGKDASQLPLRLPVAGAQRRYAIAVSAAAE